MLAKLASNSFVWLISSTSVGAASVVVLSGMPSPLSGAALEGPASLVYLVEDSFEIKQATE